MTVLLTPVLELTARFVRGSGRTAQRAGAVDDDPHRAGRRGTQHRPGDAPDRASVVGELVDPTPEAGLDQVADALLGRPGTPD